MDWNFATTLVGSQPYTNSVEAVDKILDGRIACPSWPQLPTRGYKEDMFVQTGVHLPGVHHDTGKLVVDLDNYDPTEIDTAILEEEIDYFVYPSDFYAGLFEFLERDTSKFQAIKGQITGLISEGLQVYDAAGHPVIYDESYRRILKKTINMSAKWQAKRLSKKNSHVIIFFDEPLFALLETSPTSISPNDVFNWINEVIDGVDCYRGIHCCDNANWSLFLKSNIDILSIDAYSYADNLLMFPDELTEFYGKGGVIAWGIVPSNNNLLNTEDVNSLIQKMEKIFDKLEEKGVNRQKAATQSLITPQCGLNNVGIDNIDKVFDMLDKVSKTLKEEYDLP
ncbi:MAG: hypothetical protein MJZ03_02405 [archaeon]|nr:hypothetical protein [archaeon]